MNTRLRDQPHWPRSMAGVSLIELMISLVLGMMVLAALVTVFASTSASRNELERTSRQIENGRFAMEILSDELRLAGFYGEFDVRTLTPPLPTLPNPCPDWVATMPIHVQGYDNGAGAPAGCMPGDLKANTDVLVVRRTSSCEAGVAGCAAAVAGEPYLQVSKCATEQVITPYLLGLSGTAAFTLRMKDCTTRAGLRRYLINVYYISTDNGSGVPNLPTLKMMSFDGAAFAVTPLVEGIEELNIEYGIDNDNDGAPDVYTTAPAAADWANVMTARIHLLARNVETSPNYIDAKTYSLGLNAGGAEITVTPADAYRRHIYTGLVRVVNAAERRDTP